MPQLLDENFRRAVVLILQHDESGTFGIVLNRTTGISAERLCDSISIGWHGDPDAEIHWGGPVQPQTGWVLFDGDPSEALEDEVEEVADGIHFAGSLAVLREIANDPPSDLRVMLGYAGWGAGQLEAELSEGAWLVAPLERDVLFSIDPDEMWTLVVRRLGIEPATLVASRGVH